MLDAADEIFLWLYMNAEEKSLTFPFSWKNIFNYNCQNGL